MLIQKAKQILLLILLFLTATVHAAQTVTYFHNDIAGTPLIATDASGNVVWKENYYPYGERLNPETKRDNKLWFTGKPYDMDTGLTYLGARYYNPLLGRFMGVDPADVNPKDIHSFNRYAYGNNNPYKYVDLNGKWAEEAVGGLSLAISIHAFSKNPSIFNGIVLGIDAVLVAVPFVPAMAGIAVHGTQTLRAADGASDVAKSVGNYRPERALPRDKHGNPIPDVNAPHTQLGTKSGRNGDYTQAREWGYDANGKLVPKRDIEFTDHGRPRNHPNPHQHDWVPNPTGGTRQHGPAKPLE